MKVVFCGDISVKNDNARLFAEQDLENLFNDVPIVLKGADMVVANLECAVTDKDTPIQKCGPNLAAPFGTVEVLKAAGVTHCALSNNHIFDYGKAGLYDTLAELAKNGIPYTGIGENIQDARKDLILTDGKVKVAVVNVCEHEYSCALEDRVGAREFDPFETADDIVEAKKNADYVVLVYHGGKEHCEYPSPRLKKLCRSMVKRGADLVLCQHSHCIGTYEEYEGGSILYGQGNFHFVSSSYSADNEKWNTGLMVEVEFGDRLQVKFIPVKVEGLGIRLATADEAKRILGQLHERSKALVDGSWKDRWHEFCYTVPYYSQIGNCIPEDKRELFGHFLDCEAHEDVLKELFPTCNLINEK